MRPCDESVFEFMEMRRESRWEGRERAPLGRWEGHGLFVGTFASQTHKENGNLRVDRQDKVLGGGLAGTNYEYAMVPFWGTPGLVSGPLVKS
jgi:hypothetical protein